MFQPTFNKERMSDNPNGLAWSNDDSKFGQKMLEKMGWKKGKGLGANENGRTDHVKVSLKSDKKGVGCEETHKDKWLDRLDEYEEILAKLNGSNCTSSTSNSVSQDADENKEKNEFESLDERSKNQKSRVHYSKFTKGKDLSLKSVKDLDSVFGRRSKHGDSETAKETVEPSQNERFGVMTTTSSTNLQDYFANKMAALKRSKSEPQLTDICIETNVSQLSEACDNVQELVSTKRKKKRSKKEVDSVSENDLTTYKETLEETEEKESVRCVRKKKRSRKISETPETSCEISTVDISQKTTKHSKKEVNSVAENSTTSYGETFEETAEKETVIHGRRKKRTREISETQGTSCENFAAEVSKKTTKRSKKEVNIVSQNDMANSGETVEEIEEKEAVSHGRKKKHSKEILEIQQVDSCKNGNDDVSQKKKKHRKD